MEITRKVFPQLSENIDWRIYLQTLYNSLLEPFPTVNGITEREHLLDIPEDELDTEDINSRLSGQSISKYSSPDNQFDLYSSLTAFSLLELTQSLFYLNKSLDSFSFDYLFDPNYIKAEFVLDAKKSSNTSIFIKGLDISFYTETTPYFILDSILLDNVSYKILSVVGCNVFLDTDSVPEFTTAKLVRTYDRYKFAYLSGISSPQEDLKYWVKYHIQPFYFRHINEFFVYLNPVYNIYNSIYNNSYIQFDTNCRVLSNCDITVTNYRRTGSIDSNTFAENGYSFTPVGVLTVTNSTPSTILTLNLPLTSDNPNAVNYAKDADKQVIDITLYSEIGPLNTKIISVINKPELSLDGSIFFGLQLLAKINGDYTIKVDDITLDVDNTVLIGDNGIADLYDENLNTCNESEITNTVEFSDVNLQEIAAEQTYDEKLISLLFKSKLLDTQLKPCIIDYFISIAHQIKSGGFPVILSRYQSPNTISQSYQIPFDLDYVSLNRSGNTINFNLVGNSQNPFSKELFLRIMTQRNYNPNICPYLSIENINNYPVQGSVTDKLEHILSGLGLHNENHIFDNLYKAVNKYPYITETVLGNYICLSFKIVELTEGYGLKIESDNQFRFGELNVEGDIQNTNLVGPNTPIDLDINTDYLYVGSNVWKPVRDLLFSPQNLPNGFESISIFDTGSRTPIQLESNWLMNQLDYLSDNNNYFKIPFKVIKYLGAPRTLNFKIEFSVCCFNHSGNRVGSLYYKAPFIVKQSYPFD